MGSGRRGLDHRWRTGYAFDRHARTVGAALRALRPPPDVVLQNGALFAPGAPPPSSGSSPIPSCARAMGARGRARVFAGALWGHVAERLERALCRAFPSRGRAA